MLKLNLRLFDTTTQTTLLSDLSDTMKTYYLKRLLELAKPNLVYNQFGEEFDIPKNNGKTIEMRRWDSLPKALTPLTEGVTPDGQNLNISAITATVEQFGGWIRQSDLLQLTAYDNTILAANEVLADQYARTKDTLTRDVLMAGSNVIYAPTWSGSTPTEVTSRSALNGTSVLSVDLIRTAVALLRAKNTPTIDGWYVGIINPLVAKDLMDDELWENVSTYSKPEQFFKGEIGRIAGVRFVASTEAKVWRGNALTAGSRTLTVKTTTTNTSIPVKEEITEADVLAFAARAAADKKVYIGGVERTISALVAGDAGSASITLSASATCTGDAVIAPIGATTGDLAVFGTLILGKKAYGTVGIDGAGVEFIVKQLGSAGSADPLNQRSSEGWKMAHAAKRLVEQYMIRIESTSSLSLSTDAN